MRTFVAAVFSVSMWAQSTVPVPRVTGPSPATAHIFGAAKSNLDPVDLAKAGYVEEEYFLSGTANVYDWNADGSLTVKGANNPYTTRIVVRRPAQAARFSGTVIVEILLDDSILQHTAERQREAAWRPSELFCHHKVRCEQKHGAKR